MKEFLKRTLQVICVIVAFIIILESSIKIISIGLKRIWPKEFDLPIDDRMIIIEKYKNNDNDDIYYLYDRNTKVMYYKYNTTYKSGITPLLDSDGKPLLYEENK